MTVCFAAFGSGALSAGVVSAPAFAPELSAGPTALCPPSVLTVELALLSSAFVVSPAFVLSSDFALSLH